MTDNYWSNKFLLEQAKLALANAEIDRLRAEEDAEGREIGQLHDALEQYRNKLATARRTLELLRPNVPNGADVKLIDHTLEVIS